MTDNVFNAGNQTNENQQQIEDYFAELVGEDKKFKTPQDLAKGKWEADNYIMTLEQKLDQAKAELEKRQTAAEMADQLKSLIAEREASKNSNTNSSENAGTGDQTKTQGLSQEELMALLDKRLAERESQTKAQRNVQEVTQTLREKIGATANQWLQEKASELGVTTDYLQKQAEVSPKAFYNLVGLNQTQARSGTGFVPPASSQTAGLDSGTQLRNNAYYEKMFKENPKLRFDPKITVQMHKDAQRMGVEKFFG